MSSLSLLYAQNATLLDYKSVKNEKREKDDDEDDDR